jgi:hypothetical protein
MAEKVCPKHGSYEQRRKCPACLWVEMYDELAHFEKGCPRCGEPLSSNGFIMWCGNDKCPMETTSHAAV